MTHRWLGSLAGLISKRGRGAVRAGGLVIPNAWNGTRFPQALDFLGMITDAHRRPAERDDLLPVFIHDFLLSETEPSLELSPDTLEHLGKGGRVVLDFSTEAIVEFPLDHVLSRRLAVLHREVERLGIADGQLILLNANPASATHYQRWRSTMGLACRMKLVGYDFYIYEALVGLRRKFADGRHTSWIDQIAANEPDTGPARRMFSCLNLDPKPHRFAVIAFLEHLGIADRCVLTLLCAPDDLQRLIEPVGEYFADQPDRNQIVDAARRVIARAPIGLGHAERGGPIEQIMHTMHHNQASVPEYWDCALLPDPDGRYASILSPACFYIATETWFTDDTCSYMTEKVIRPLALLKPFLVAGTPYTLSRLRSLGFRTFSPGIDESYDQIADPKTRMVALCRETERLAGLKPEALRALLRELWPAVLHNFEHLVVHSHGWARDQLTGVLRQMAAVP